MQPFPLRGPGFVYAGAISPGRDGFSRSQAGFGDCWGVAVGAGAAFATQGNGANRGEPAQLHADVGRGCLWGAEGRVLPVLCPGAPLLCHLCVPASCVPTYRCSPCGSSTTVAPVLPSPSPLPCAGAEGVQSILGSAGRFWGKTKALPPRCILGIPAPVCAPLLSAVREGARAAPVGSWCTSSCIKNGLGQRRANHPSLPRSSKALAPRAASSWRRAGEAFELIGSSLPPART